MYNSPDIAIRIKEKLSQQGKSVKEMLLFCELGVNTLSHMNHGKAIASNSLAKIADYLNCSVDYLLSREKISEEQAETYSSDEKELLSDYRTLSEQGKEYIRQTMFLSKQIYKNKPLSSNHLEEISK